MRSKISKLTQKKQNILGIKVPMVLMKEEPIVTKWELS
jgi:hypothetical protein